jgi:hypothetical protein
VAQRGVGEQAGDLPVKDAPGQGVLRDAHSFKVAEGEARELLCPRLASLGYFQLSIHVLSVGNL